MVSAQTLPESEWRAVAAAKAVRARRDAGKVYGSSFVCTFKLEPRVRMAALSMSTADFAILPSCASPCSGTVVNGSAEANEDEAKPSSSMTTGKDAMTVYCRLSIKVRTRPSAARSTCVSSTSVGEPGERRSAKSLITRVPTWLGLRRRRGRSKERAQVASASL